MRVRGFAKALADHIDTPEPFPGSHRIKSRRILVVEDDPVLSGMIRSVLERKGFIVEIAPDGERALALLGQRKQPSVVLLDLTLPRRDGFEVLGKIRRDPLWREIPVIVLTAARETGTAVRAFRKGANDYITKPVQFGELAERIDIFAL